MVRTGQLIAGRYELETQLGQGGVGVVFRAHDRLTDSDVALKLLRRPRGERGSSLALRHEFRAMSRLGHPNLVAVRDWGTTDSGEDYFTMELVEGTDLDKVGPLTLDEIRWVLGEIARALAFIHSRGFVHRDLKPSNVRLLQTPDGKRFVRAKVMDLGLLGRAGEQANEIIGTPSYLPPEVIFGGVVDRRSDFYSLGVLAYELCCGKVPHKIASVYDLLQVDFRTPIDPRLKRHDLPDDLSRLITDLLSVDPNRRPWDAAEVADRIGQPLEEPSADGGSEASYLKTAVVVGRSAEVERLRALWAEARRGGLRAANVRARAGAGKTRLLREFVVEAKLDGALVLEAQCHDRAEAPFAVLRALLEPLLMDPIAREELYGLDEASLLQRLVPEAAKLPGLPEAKEYLDPAYAREQAFALAARWLAKIAARGRPILVSVDDLQWCDAASLDALTALLGAAPDAHLLFVGTERQEAEVPSRIELPAEEIALGPLGQTDVRALLAAMFGVPTSPDALVDHLQRASQGNAYFLVELVRSLQESGQIRRVSGRWELPVRPVVERLPTSLEEAIDRRIERLSESARRVADAACVLESELSTDLIQALAQLDGDALFDAIDELVRAELWTGSAGRWQFRHARCRERLYRALTQGELEERHFYAAETLAAIAGRDDTRAAEIGEHYARGPKEAREQAITYLLRGANLLWEAQAYADLSRPLEQARLLIPEGDPRLLLALNRLGRACFYSDHHRAVEYFEKLRAHHFSVGALRWLPSLASKVGRHLALAIVILASWVMSRVQRKPLRFTAIFETLLEVFKASAFLSAALAYCGRLTEALEVGRSLDPLVMSKRKLPYAGRMICEFVPCNWQGRYGDSTRAINAALRCFEIDEKTPILPFDRAVAVCGAMTGRAFNVLWRGHVDCEPLLDELRREIDRHELFFVRIMYHEAAMNLRINRGQLEEAEREFAESVALSRRAGHVPLIDGSTRICLARAYWQVGRLREAYDLAREVMDREARNPMLHGLASEVAGRVNLAWGRLDRAEAQLRRCLVAGQDPAMRSAMLVLRGHIGLGALELERRQLGAAESHLRSAIKLAATDPYRNEAEETAAQRLLALLCALQNDRAGAQAALARVEELAQRLGSGVLIVENGRVAARVEALLRGDTAGPMLPRSFPSGAFSTSPPSPTPPSAPPRLDSRPPSPSPSGLLTPSGPPPTARTPEPGAPAAPIDDTLPAKHTIENTRE